MNELPELRELRLRKQVGILFLGFCPYLVFWPVWPVFV